jgi:3-oxoacyl-[acyl-carrier protein] reductase
MYQGPHTYQSIHIALLVQLFKSSELLNPPRRCSIYLREPAASQPAGAARTARQVQRNLIQGTIHMSKLTGKVAVVTGASKGIGAAIAKSLAAEGASVVVNYASSKAGAEAVVSSITAAGGKAVAVQGSVAQAAEAQAIIGAAIQNYGRLDILVNNSGVYEFAPIEAITEDHYHKIFNVNVLGLLLVTQAAAKHLGEGASIINIGSIITSNPSPATAVYAGTKGAVDVITGVLAKELAPRKIRVNSINPGMVDTEGVRTAGVLGSDFEKDVVAQTPLGRIGQPDDIATAVTFLATEDAKWITGEIIRVGGGLH